MVVVMCVDCMTCVCVKLYLGHTNGVLCAVRELDGKNLGSLQTAAYYYMSCSSCTMGPSNSVGSSSNTSEMSRTTPTTNPIQLLV